MWCCFDDGVLWRCGLVSWNDLKGAQGFAADVLGRSSLVLNVGFEHAVELEDGNVRYYMDLA